MVQLPVHDSVNEQPHMPHHKAWHMLLHHKQTGKLCKPSPMQVSHAQQAWTANSSRSSALKSMNAGMVCSGMLPGLVAGFYTFDECHVDLAQLCTFASARMIHAEAIGIDKQVRNDVLQHNKIVVVALHHFQCEQSLLPVSIYSAVCM